MNETDTPTETQLRLVTADGEELVPEEPEDIGNIGVTGGHRGRHHRGCHARTDDTRLRSDSH
jgi:hypothetical protein